MTQGDKLISEEQFGEWITRTYQDSDGRLYTQVVRQIDELKKLLAENDRIIDELMQRLKVAEGTK